MTSFRATLDARASATETADRIALIDGRSHRSWSFAEYAALVRQCESVLVGMGLRRGDCVATVLPNSVEVLVIFGAAASAGLVFAPLPTDATVSVMRQTLTAVKPKVLFATPFLIAKQNEVLDAAAQIGRIERRNIVLDGQFTWLEDKLNAVPVPDQEDSKLVIYTSGTTSSPKIIQWTVSELMCNAATFAATYPMMTQEDVLMNNFSMSYLGGYLNGFLVPFSVGAASVITDSPISKSVQTLWHDINRFGVSIIWQPPAVLRQLILDYRQYGDSFYGNFKSSVKLAYTGLAPSRLQLKTEFQDTFGLPVYENYGLSETGFLTAERPDAEAARLEGSVGTFLPGVEHRLSDMGDKGTGLQILVKPPHMADGYLEPEAGTIIPIGDAQGFVETGDSGLLTADGSLILLGRLRNIIKRGETLIRLSDIEDTAASHPEVEAVAAHPISDRDTDETFDLYIKCRHSTEETLKAEISAWLRGVVDADHWPNRIRFVEELQMTRSGKIDLKALARKH